MRRLGVFADVSNLYYCIGKKFPNRKLDYRKYMAFVKDLGEISLAIAYGSQIERQASGFIYCLKRIGFTTRFKTPRTYLNESEETITMTRKANWDVDIVIDMVSMIERIDMVILGSGDGDFAPAIEWVRSRGREAVVIATGISRDLRAVATECIEIPESLLEVPKPKGAKTPADMIDQSIELGQEIK